MNTKTLPHIFIEYDPNSDFPCSDGKLDKMIEGYLQNWEAEASFQTSSMSVLYALCLRVKRKELTFTVIYDDIYYQCHENGTLSSAFWEAVTKNNHDFYLNILLALAD